MPRPSQNKRLRIQGESDLEDEPSTSQTSVQNSTQRSSGNTQEHRLVSDLVSFMLIMDQTKYAIKRQDITKNVLKEKSSQFVKLFQKAKQALLEVYGIEVIELQDKKGHYMLVNAQTCTIENNYLSWSQEECRHLGLLNVVLTIIYMNGNAISENELWLALKKFGIDKEAGHDELGDVSKLFKKFVRQLYLEFNKVPNCDPPIVEVTWGPRAKKEVSKMDLLQFVCEVYDGVAPDKWSSQYHDALKETSRG